MVSLSRRVSSEVLSGIDLRAVLSVAAGVVLCMRVLLDLLLDGDVLLLDLLDVDAGAFGSPSRRRRTPSRGRCSPCMCPLLFAALLIRAP